MAFGMQPRPAVPSSAHSAAHSSRRNAVIAGSVLAFHALALWALQSGLVRRAIDIVVPVALLSEIVTPPAPKVEVPVPVAPQPRREPVTRKAPVTVTAPEPAAVRDAPPSPNAPTGTLEPQPAPAPIATPVAPVAVAAPPPPPAKVELPSSSAAYLQNPLPHYPPLSKRLGEQGTVRVNVLIGPDGQPQKAELKKSSGYDRLDRSALDYVMKCRYLPGKVGGVLQAMWYEAPVHFVLE